MSRNNLCFTHGTRDGVNVYWQPVTVIPATLVTDPTASLPAGDPPPFRADMIKVLQYALEVSRPLLGRSKGRYRTTRQQTKHAYAPRGNWRRRALNLIDALSVPLANPDDPDRASPLQYSTYQKILAQCDNRLMFIG